MEGGALQTHLHGMIVHFPIALLFASVAIELLALYRPWQERLRAASFITLLFGTLGAALAVLTGPERIADSFTLGETHEHFAQATLALFGILLVWRLGMLWWKRSFDTKLVAVYLVLCSIGLGLLGYTGFLGGTMVYEQGAGVRTNGQLVVPVNTERHGGHD